MPKISVIIPCYKVEQYLEQCVNSVLCQSFSDFELILVDDGSPDRCGEICDKYARKDNRVIVIHQPNKGVSAARNAGTNRAVGTYIIYLDSDDYWLANDFLERLYNEIEESSADMVIFQYMTLKLNGMMKPPKRRFPIEQINSLPAADAICKLISSAMFTTAPWSRIFRHAILKENKLIFDEELISSADIDWGIDMVLHVKKINAIDYPAYVYRIRMDSHSGMRAQDAWDRRYRIIKKWLPKLTEEIADKKLAYSLLGYLSWQYAIWLGTVAHMEDAEQQKTAYEKAKELKPIIQYRVNWKTWLSWILIKLTGIRFSSQIFDWYIHGKRNPQMSIFIERFRKK